MNGKEVRDYWDIDFTQGANDYARSWMPKNEIWIDDANVAPSNEVKDIVLHEVFERNEMMEYGLVYDDAHDHANIVEQEVRDHPETYDALMSEQRERLLRLQPPVEKLAKRKMKRLASMTHKTPQVRVGEKILERKIRLGLKRLAAQAGEIARHHLGIKKADESPAVPIAVESIMEGLDWEILVDPTEQQLRAVALDAAKRAVIALGINDDRSIVDQVYQAAADWAKDRAAELVGMSYNAKGDLIPNPNASMAITDTVRDDLRAEVASAIEEGIPAADLADNIEELSAFGPDRAMMIARTEIIRANNQGHVTAFKESGVVEQVEWSTAEDPDACDECTGNQDQGPIDLGEDFDSGDSEPPAHPNCRCVLVPIVANTTADEEGDEE